MASVALPGTFGPNTQAGGGRLLAASPPRRGGNGASRPAHPLSTQNTHKGYFLGNAERTCTRWQGHPRGLAGRCPPRGAQVADQSCEGDWLPVGGLARRGHEGISGHRRPSADPRRVRLRLGRRAADRRAAGWERCGISALPDRRAAGPAPPDRHIGSTRYPRPWDVLRKSCGTGTTTREETSVDRGQPDRAHSVAGLRGRRRGDQLAAAGQPPSA